MTGMNVWKRATLAIVRKPVRSGIIGLLMLMVFTSLVAQVGASTALQKMSDDIGGSLGIGFTVDTGENPVSPKEASRFSRIPGVGKTVYERKTLAQVDGAHPVVPVCTIWRRIPASPPAGRAIHTVLEKTMEAAKKLPVDWNNYQITRNDQYTSSMLNAARSVRSMMRGALIGVTISAVIVLSLMLLLSSRLDIGRSGMACRCRGTPIRPSPDVGRSSTARA